VEVTDDNSSDISIAGTGDYYIKPGFPKSHDNTVSCHEIRNETNLHLILCAFQAEWCGENTINWLPKGVKLLGIGSGRDQESDQESWSANSSLDQKF